MRSEKYGEGNEGLMSRLRSVGLERVDANERRKLGGANFSVLPPQVPPSGHADMSRR